MWTMTLKMGLKRTLQRLIGLKSLNEDDTSILGIGTRKVSTREESNLPEEIT